MNYIILSQKFRPKTFKQIIGQKNIISALSNSFKIKKIHHAWIFSGTRGTGKTTIARILSKMLNCEKKNNIHPCNKCKNCKNINNKCFPDLLEIDAASKTGVEDIKEILNFTKYKPIEGKYKIFLIDEIHMLSKHSFNALLKTLEEPPKYIKFILITTEINKLPKTIISRCLNFHFHKIQKEKIQKFLISILKKENIKFEQKALNIISEYAKGSIRDALNLTEKAIIMNHKIIKYNNILNMFGILHKQHALEIIESIIKKNIIKLMYLLNKIYKSDIELEQILIMILKIFHKITILKRIPQCYQNIKFFKQQSTILKISKIIKYEDLKKYYKIILKGKKNLHIFPNKKIGIEITLLNILDCVQ